MATYTQERVLDVRHWSDKLFSFRTSRGPGLRFENGQFLMLGLDAEGRRIARAFSIASPNYEDHLEFYSIKVPSGPLTSRLQHVKEGDALWVSSKPTGTLLLSDLRPGERLFLLATGTGIAPFASLIRDPELYERFAQVILVRGGRVASDLAYGTAVVAAVREHEYLGASARRQLFDHASLTREPFAARGRTTELLDSGRVTQDLRLAPLNPHTDRFMVCGNMRMLEDARLLMDRRGFVESPEIGTPGDYVIERAFVESVPRAARPADDMAGHGAGTHVA